MSRRSNLQFLRALKLSSVILLAAAGACPTWAKTFEAFGPETFVRSTGAPMSVVRSFGILTPNTTYTLRINNGGLNGDLPKVSSAVVTLNGVQIVGPDEFDRTPSVIEKPINLSFSNQLIVQLRSAPGSGLALQIIGVDNDPPTISAIINPAPNAAGWNNSNVTVSFTCSDKTSGVASCPSPVAVTTEGANQIVSGTSLDKAGNSASTSVTVNLDKTPPAIAASPSPLPNLAHWNNTPVTVSFTCTDSLSGIASCPQPKLVSTDGANQTVTGTTTDIAGNTATASTAVNLDTTPPIVSANPSPAPNANGWNNTNMTVTFTCSDSLSGIATCPGAQTITTEGANQVIAGTATDNAGNKMTTSVTINLDKTPPNVTIDSTKNGSVISLSTPSITLGGTANDNLSGLAGVTCNGTPAAISASTYVCTVPLAAGSNSISIQATDLAGNKSNSAPLGLTYAPAPQITITSPANLTITNITPVTVSGTISDPTATVTINGIAALQGNGGFSIPVPLVEGLNILTAVATNSSSVVSTATTQVTLDTTPPHLTIDSPADGTATTDASVTVSGLANDVVVGTVNAQDVQVTINGLPAQVANRTYSVANVPLSAGKNTIQAKGVDRAGNGTTVSITVTRVLPSQPPPPAVGKAVITDSLSVISGNNQTGVIGAQLSSPLVIVLKDSLGNPVPNQTVVFKVTGNNGLVAAGGGARSSAVAITTDANGQAQALWTLGQRSGAGINAVQVSSALAIGPANFSATGVTGPAGQIVVDSGNQQTGAIGQGLPFPFVAAVVDSGHNRVANIPVTFTVKSGGGSLGGATTQTVTTDSNGRAIVVLTLGLEEGFENNLVEATFPGSSGFPVAFVATAKVPGNPANTTISGVVLDNSNNPIPGVTMRLYETNQGNANNLPMQVGTPVQTNAQGTFLIPSAPVGSFKLMADGTTSTAPQKYPTLEYDMVTIAGNDNNVGMPIYLPALDTVNKLCVDASHGGTLTLPQVSGFSLTVLAGSATFPGGSKQGCITVTPVNGDKVPMAPGFGQQPRFIVTIQPVGTTFNPPAPITLPNVDGLQPRQVTEMYSYDHDLGMFVAIGTGTVSADGSVIASNAGVGVLKAGWHCGGDPDSTGSAGTCPVCNTCDGSSCLPDPSQDGASCSIGSVVDGVCETGVCVASNAELEIDQPNSNSQFSITSDPHMPQLAAHAEILHVDPDPTASTEFEWTAEIDYTGPDGSDFNFTFAASTSVGGSYTPDTGGATRGGDLTYTASATVNGKVLTGETQGLMIVGTNPSHQQVNAALGGFPATNIACWESNHKLAQFNSQGLPLFGAPHGYGIMQLDPPPSAEDVWNWSQNVSDGLGVLATKLADAKGYPKRVQQTFPDATDFVALGLIEPVTGLPYLDFEWIQRYNGGSYWKWDDVDKVWVAAPPNNYVANVLNSTCP